MILLMPHCGFLSETTRMLHIAQALRARGQAVRLATHGGPFVRILQTSGIPCTLIEPRMDDARCARFLRDLVQIGRHGVRLQPPDEVRRSVAAEVALMRSCGARAVVIGFTLTACLSSRVAGIPLIASHGGSYVPPVFERGLAPIPTAMPIPGTDRLPAWLKRKIVNGGPLRLTDPTRFLNDIADELGVEPVPTLAALMLGDLTLVTDVPEVLGIPADELAAWRPRRPKAVRPGARLVYTGPLFARLDAPVPDAVEDFLDGSQPTAFVSLSSATADTLRAVLARVLAAGVRVVVAATVHDLAAASGARVVAADVLPNHRIMPRVDLVIAMGGQGTIQTAMATGTPVIGIPLHPEQELNVDLAVRHGAGQALALRHVDTPRLTDMVRRMIRDPRFRNGAARTRDWYAGVDGADRAAAEIQHYLSDGDGSR